MQEATYALYGRSKGQMQENVKNMNAYIEEQIVIKFMKKQHQDRALYMLNSKKKRDRFLLGLTKDFFVDRYIHVIPKKNNTVSQLIMTLNNLSKRDEYYLMMPGMLDGDNATLEATLSTLFGFGPFLLYFMNCSFCYFEEEQAYGAPGRYLLWREEEKPL